MIIATVDEDEVRQIIHLRQEGRGQGTTFKRMTQLLRI